MTTPDWLARHDGSLRPGPNGATWFVTFTGSPQYRVEAVPAGGRVAAVVTQTVNGKRLDSDGRLWPNVEEAVRGGLESLRTKLGW
jgi:hypothetical protein